MSRVGMRPRARSRAPVLGILVASLLLGSDVAAAAAADRATSPQKRESPGTPRVTAAAIPPPPVAPEVVSRDDAGRVTVRAIPLAEPLRVDGVLDEEVYRSVPAIGDFIQSLPQEGAPATERTEAWVMFDAEHIYIAGRCWDSAPPEQWVANEMRRDLLTDNDNFGVVLDTFHDRRNGYMMYTNPLGARQDIVLTDEGNANMDWSPVWHVRTGRFEGGWTVEMAIPFKSLRYRSGKSQHWGIQIRRAIRRKNEWTHLTPVPGSLAGSQGFQRVSLAATLVGLDLPPASRNLEIKPYAISRVITDRLRTPASVNDAQGDIGLDVKYGVTANLTADVTYNTDFAQVEVDQQQINLTRFNLFFPEKRDFFLEGRGIFEFGRTTRGGLPPVSEDTPAVFYSRRIGLNRNRPVPIDVGGRLTGKIGKMSLGVMNIETGEDAADQTPATNFTVIRVKRDILQRSSVGVLFTNRSDSFVTRGTNQAFGMDANFSFLRTITFGGYFAGTKTAGLEGDDHSYQGRFDYFADRYGVHLEHLRVGDDFNPEIGFVRRADFRLTRATARFSPRPGSMPSVRKFTFEAMLDYVENGARVLETREQAGRFHVEFENGNQFAALVSSNYELLVIPFTIAPGIAIPAGGYRFANTQVSYSLAPQRRVSGSLSLQRGNFYDGTITGVGYTAARVSVTPHFSIEPNVSVNRVELPVGNFTTRLVRARTDYGFSPWMSASGLFQYNATDRSFSTNLRYRWEYRPGSELFVVYTDDRDTATAGYPTLENRAFVVKINRLLQF